MGQMDEPVDEPEAPFDRRQQGHADVGDHRGSYSTIQVDLRDPDDKRPDTRAADESEPPEPGAGGADTGSD